MESRGGGQPDSGACNEWVGSEFQNGDGTDNRFMMSTGVEVEQKVEHRLSDKQQMGDSELQEEEARARPSNAQRHRLTSFSSWKALAFGFCAFVAWNVVIGFFAFCSAQIGEELFTVMNLDMAIGMVTGLVIWRLRQTSSWMTDGATGARDSRSPDHSWFMKKQTSSELQ